MTDSNNIPSSIIQTYLILLKHLYENEDNIHSVYLSLRNIWSPHQKDIPWTFVKEDLKEVVCIVGDGTDHYGVLNVHRVGDSYINDGLQIQNQDLYKNVLLPLGELWDYLQVRKIFG